MENLFYDTLTSLFFLIVVVIITLIVVIIRFSIKDILYYIFDLFNFWDF